jgi:hypothetical protein
MATPTTTVSSITTLKEQSNTTSISTTTIYNSTVTTKSVVSTTTTQLSASCTCLPTSTNSPVLSNEGVSVGKAVGIGFGGAAVGALLLLLVAIVYVWHQRNAKSSRRLPHIAPSLPGTSALVSSSVSPGYIQEKLPQPITRDEIAKEASRLESAIRNYVDNFTDCQTPPKRHYDGSQLDTSGLSEYSQYHIKWEVILSDDSERYDALRMFIARVLAARIAATGAPSSTLLPAGMLETYQQIVAGRKRDREFAFPRSKR